MLTKCLEFFASPFIFLTFPYIYIFSMDDKN